MCLTLVATAKDDALRFDVTRGEVRSMTMPNGKMVDYIAWEGIYYVTNVEDSTYQSMNFYAPVTSAERKDVPILLRNNVGGYMSARAKQPSPTDATGRALSEGYAVCIPGTRGSNATVETATGETVFTGRAPAGLLDLKAVVRYLRHNNSLMPGNAERIISDGTSAGGAMSALLGATGNHPIYEKYLVSMGAARARDDIFAAVCYCPITDLDHADMAYEWLYSVTNDGARHLSEEQKIVSQELSAAFPLYLTNLGLKTEDGTPLTEDNYMDYLKGFLIESVQRAVNETCQIPDSIGIVMYSTSDAGHSRPPRGGFQRGRSEFVADIDMGRYLNYLASTTHLKAPPAFDAQGVLRNAPTPENRVFGDSGGGSVNFTEYSSLKANGDANATLTGELSERVGMMNPMKFIGDKYAITAKHWYIRHGARDCDTSFPIPVNLATKLRNHGYEVDFALPWNRPHSGDYNLDDLFGWIASITAK